MMEDKIVETPKSNIRHGAQISKGLLFVFGTITFLLAVATLLLLSDVPKLF